MKEQSFLYQAALFPGGAVASHGVFRVSFWGNFD
jgi:hypothetical protein